MPITRAQLRSALVGMIRAQQEPSRAEHDRRWHEPWPPPYDFAQRDQRSAAELIARTTDPVSMRVLVQSSMLYQSGLETPTWPKSGSGEADRYSPYFKKATGHDYRIDLLYVTHYNTLAIAEGTGVALIRRTTAEIWDGAVLPALPSRGVPLAYIIIFGDTTTIQIANIVDVRPLIVRIASQDVDAETWQTTQDFSSQCDGSRSAFTFDLPVAGDRAIVKLNGVVQQPTVSYSVSGGSLALTFAPYTGEVLTAEYELGDKENYSGWGMTPWGTGLYGV